MLRTVTATRYVTPLREGGSLPAIVEADDDGLYVLKFHGAGQGPKVLVAELVVGEIGRALGLPVPEIVFVELDPALGRNEPDFEVKALLERSSGLNLALDYLPGSLTYDTLLYTPEPELASAIVWLDAYVSNVDRTARNVNMLLWHKQLYLIDHGAALYFHHAPVDFLSRSRSRFPQIKDHVLLRYAGRLAEVDQALSARLTPRVLRQIVELVPDVWLEQKDASSPEEQRERYLAYLTDRLEAPRAFVEEAIDARAQLV